MKEGMKNKINWMHMFITILITTLIFSVIILKYHNVLKEAKEIYVLQMVTQVKKLHDLTVENAELKYELAEIKQRIADRAPDEILVDDIAKYIHVNFPIIPDVLYKEIAIQIATISRQENISPELIVGVTQVESAFNPMAISSKNARGLMQVMPMWAKHFKLNKVCDLHNVNVGISTGIKVLKVHIEEEDGDVSEGLYKYVNKDRSYVDRVYTAMGKFVMFRGPVADNKGEVNDTNSRANETSSRSVGHNNG